MRLNLKNSFVLLLIMPLVQPVFGQVPVKQVVKEAERIFDTEINLVRKELGAGRSEARQADAPAKPGLRSHKDVSLQPGVSVQPEHHVPSEDATQPGVPLQPEPQPQPGVPLHQADELFAVYADGETEPRGYCFASSAKGRFENFEYFILYDTACVVQKVKVWKYRSSHGGAVAGKRWLRQFDGYRKGALSYGKDVQAISGATISGNALVSEVVRAGKVMEKVVH